MPKQAYTDTYRIQPYFSDVVLGYVMGSDIGYAFKEVTLVMTDTLHFGSILGTDLTEAAAAGAADSVFVWTDEFAFGADVLPAVGAEFRAVVAKRAATLNRFKLVYSDGSAIDDAGVAALEAKGLVVTDYVLLPTT